MLEINHFYLLLALMLISPRMPAPRLRKYCHSQGVRSMAAKDLGPDDINVAYWHLAKRLYEVAFELLGVGTIEPDLMAVAQGAMHGPQQDVHRGAVSAADRLCASVRRHASGHHVPSRGPAGPASADSHLPGALR